MSSTSRGSDRAPLDWYRTSADAARFWSKVDRSAGPHGCWPWQAGTDKDGYGKFQTGPAGHQTHHRAHRFALQLALGRIDELVLHHCDKPSCCNPLHLYQGTQLSNRRDAVLRGRTARGSRHPNAKMSERHARQIKASDEPARTLARRLGVTPAMVHQVRRGITWGHVS